MIPFAYHYRRRHFDAIHAIDSMPRMLLARRDDAQLGVFDYQIWKHREYMPGEPDGWPED
jgi:hypothetical protein